MVILLVWEDLETWEPLEADDKEYDNALKCILNYEASTEALADAGIILENGRLFGFFYSI